MIRKGVLFDIDSTGEQKLKNTLSGANRGLKNLVASANDLTGVGLDRSLQGAATRADRLRVALDDVNDELEKQERAARAARAALESPQTIRRLKAARAEVERLDRATMSFGERVATALESAENVVGALDLAVVAIEVAGAAFQLWETGQIRADMEETARSLGIAAGSLEQLRAQTGGILTETEAAQSRVGGRLTGLTSGQQGQAQDLGMQLARMRAASGQGDLREILPQAIAEVQRDIAAGGRGGAIDELLGSQEVLSQRLEEAARAQGTTVAALSDATRVQIALETATTRSAERLEGISTQGAERAAGVEGAFFNAIEEVGGAAGLLFEAGSRLIGSSEALSRAAAPNAAATQEQAATDVLAQTRASVGGASDLAAAREILATAQARVQAGAATTRELQLQLRSLQSISGAQAARLLNERSIGTAASQAERFGARALQLARDSARARVEGLRAQLERNDALSQGQRIELESQLVEARRDQSIAAYATSYEQIVDLALAAREERATTLEQEARRIAVQQESAAILSQQQSQLLAVQAEYNRIERAALAVTETQEEYDQVVRDAVISRALQAQQGDWATILDQVGLTSDEIKVATQNAATFSGALRRAFDADELGSLGEDLLGILSGLGGDDGGGRRGRAFDVDGFVRGMRRDLEDARTDLLELRGQTPVSPLALLIGESDLVGHLTPETQRAATELERWRQDQVERARGNAEAIEAVGEVYRARAEVLVQGLRSQALEAGVAAASDFARGLVSQIGVAADGVNVFLEQAQASADRFAAARRSTGRRAAGRLGDRALIDFDHAQQAEGFDDRRAEIDRESLSEAQRAVLLEEIRSEELEARSEYLLAVDELEQEHHDRQMERTAELQETTLEYYRVLRDEGSDTAAGYALASGLVVTQLDALQTATRKADAAQAQLAAGHISASEAAWAGAGAIADAMHHMGTASTESRRAVAAVDAAYNTYKAAEAAAHLNFFSAGKHLSAAVGAGAMALGGGGGGGSTGGASAGGDSARQQRRERAQRRIDLGNDRARLDRNAGPSVINQYYLTNYGGRRGGEHIIGLLDQAQRGGTARQISSGLVSDRTRDEGL